MSFVILATNISSLRDFLGKSFLCQQNLATLVAIKKNRRWQFVAANSCELPKAQETKTTPNSIV